MRRKIKLLIGAVISTVFLIITACTQNTNSSTNPTSETDIKNSETSFTATVLTEAPELQLSDPLSSTMNEFILKSGSYNWSYMENEEVQSVIACGLHPLDSSVDKFEKLSLPRYNQLDSISYRVSCPVPYDYLTAKEWDYSHIGDTDVKEEANVTYKEMELLELKPNKIYQITAIWEEAKKNERNFWGNADYILVTN